MGDWKEKCLPPQKIETARLKFNSIKANYFVLRSKNTSFTMRKKKNGLVTMRAEPRKENAHVVTQKQTSVLTDEREDQGIWTTSWPRATDRI